MKTSTVRKSFVDTEQTLSLSHTYRNGVYYHLIAVINEPIYAEHIKDICIQEIHPFFEELSSDIIDNDTIERLLEESMQKVNHNLALFAEKVESKEPIKIHGWLVISYQGNLVASLIGDSSLIVCRGNKSIYSMANTDSVKKNIDQFTDYITGSIHKDDRILLLGTDHTLFFHQKDIDELAEIIEENNDDMLVVLESMITQRVEPEMLSYMSLISNASQTLHIPGTQKASQLFSKLSTQPVVRFLEPVRNYITTHKYNISIGILWIIVIWYIYTIIAWAIQTTDNTTITTEEGVQVVTIEDIKKSIAYFQNLDPTSNEKSKVYQDITQKLEFLESKNRRPEDVKQLKKIVQNKYYEGFRIAYINQLDDPNGGEFQASYPFADGEIKTLWSPINFFYEKWFIIWGSKWAILKAISKDIRWTSIDYALSSTMKKCSQDLSRAGLYCFDDTNNIYRISAWSIQPVQWNDSITLPTDIQDIWIFGKSNLYLLINPISNGGVDVIKRLRNEVGSMTVFKESIGYSASTDWSGNVAAFNSMMIDGTFLVWSPTDKKLYQLRRDTNPTKLNQRMIPMQWWDNNIVTYSSNVKVITYPSSNYVYLFDKDNQTFTVYKWSPLKTNTANINSYVLTYVMRYNFDVTNKIIDVTVPENAWDKPIIYVMNSQWIFEANLWNTISVFEKK